MKSNKFLLQILAVGTIVFVSSTAAGMTQYTRPDAVASECTVEHMIKLPNITAAAKSILASIQTANKPKYTLSSTGYYETGNSQYKPYEDYWMITDTTSAAYQFLNSSNVEINDEGYLMYQDEYYCIALGHYFGTIGDKFLITLDTGFQFKAIIGDMKSKLHTDENNYAHTNGHIVEFIIDSTHPYMQSINIKYHGLINVADSKFFGSITNIERIEDIA